MQSVRSYGIVLLGTGLVLGFLIASAGIKVESSAEAAGGMGAERTRRLVSFSKGLQAIGQRSDPGG